MSDLEQHLRQLVRVADPDGTVTIRWLAKLVGVSLHQEESSQEAVTGDLTVDEAAAYFRRSGSTVRGWLGRGELRGYKLNKRDWRVPRAALAEYERKQEEAGEVNREEVDIGEWRRIRIRRGD